LRDFLVDILRDRISQRIAAHGTRSMSGPTKIASRIHWNVINSPCCLTRKLTAFCIKLFNSRRANVEEFRLLVLICLALALFAAPWKRRVDRRGDANSSYPFPYKEKFFLLVPSPAR
jgi:hypothetical protein